MLLSRSLSPWLQNWTPSKAWPGQGKWHPEIKKAEGKKKKTKQKIKTRKQKDSAGGHHLPTSAVEGSQALPLWSCT